MIRRRTLLATPATLASTSALAQLLPGEGPPRPGVRKRIAILATGTPVELVWIERFRSALARHGWVEGRNLTIDRRYFGDDTSLLQRHADEVVASRPDAIFAPATAAVVPLMNRTKDIPIVFALPVDPVAEGIAESYRRAGRNATGLSGAAIDHFNSVGKRMELLREVRPTIGHVAFLAWRDHPAREMVLPAVAAAAAHLGVKSTTYLIGHADEIESAIDSAVRDGADGALVQWDNFSVVNRRRYVEALDRARLPAIWTIRPDAEAGGLMSYGARIEDNYPRAAFYVDRILRGVNPAELPIEQPRYYDLILNQKTVDKLGITFPFTILIRAEDIIE
jgi:putative ABC transport system substrate-binding protein